MNDLIPSQTAMEYLIRLAMDRENFRAKEERIVRAADRGGWPPERIADLCDTTVERVREILSTL